MKKLALVMIVGAILISGCKKTGGSDEQASPTGEEDTLSEEENLFLDGISVPNPKLSDILGSDGQPIRRTLQITTSKDLIQSLIVESNYLSSKKSENHPNQGTNKPEHWGFAYSFGQRNLNERLSPPVGNERHKSDQVYGTDCSGMMINILNTAGVDISKATTTKTFENNLQTALSNSSEFNGLKLVNLGRMPLNQIITGDFILWQSHVGIICELKNKSKIIYQSNGTGYPPDAESQKKNLGMTRGINQKDLSLAINGRGFWGDDYKILRLVGVGDSLAGGIIFYVSDDKKYGLVAARNDQSSGIYWGANKITGANEVGFGLGDKNTNTIVQVYGNSNNAAYLCSVLELNNFSDWYLPSRDELLRMWSRLKSNDIGNFSSTTYWSSSEHVEDASWCVDFSDGTGYKHFKSKVFRVRAIRKVNFN